MWRKRKDKGPRLRKNVSLKEVKVFTVMGIWKWSGENVIGDCTNTTKYSIFETILRSMNLILRKKRKY